MICSICKVRETKTSGPRARCCKRCYGTLWRKANRRRYLEIAKKSHDKFMFGGNREVALKRDNYQCVLCDSKRKLHVHHIDGNGVKVPKEKRNNNINNLATLCASCHRKIEAKERIVQGKSNSNMRLPLNKWSRNFEVCVKCRQKNFKHTARGYCRSCFQKERVLRWKQEGKKYWKNWKQNNKILREGDFIHPKLYGTT